MNKSNNRKRRGVLAIRLAKQATRMLIDFANCSAEEEGFKWFKRRWVRPHVDGLEWLGGFKEFQIVKSIVQRIWEGKLLTGDTQVLMYLGFIPFDDSDTTRWPPVHVDLKLGEISLRAKNFTQLILITAIQNSHRMGFCSNHDRPEIGCITPCFIKYRPNDRYCSSDCGAPARRVAKKKWWDEHGEDWRRSRKMKRKKTKRGKVK